MIERAKRSFTDQVYRQLSIATDRPRLIHRNILWNAIRNYVFEIRNYKEKMRKKSYIFSSGIYAAKRTLRTVYIVLELGIFQSREALARAQKVWFAIAENEWLGAHKCIPV